jgi:hypothetical protein
MKVAVILGAGEEAMIHRLIRAEMGNYDKIIITGREHDPISIDNDTVGRELDCLDELLLNKGVPVEKLPVYTTFGSYQAVCESTAPDDDLFFIGHESHRQRMQTYKQHFGHRNIENVVIGLNNLRRRYNLFDRASAAVYRTALQYVPGLLTEQTRDHNSFLNRVVIPAKNFAVNR